MDNSILNYLKQEEYKNIYILRAFLNKMEGFHYQIELDSDEQIKGIAAIWEKDQAVTLRGEKSFCVKCFNRHNDRYNFYDLDKELFQTLLSADCCDIRKKNISHNLIMVGESNKFTVDNEKVQYKKVTRDQWKRIALFYSEKYNKKFTDFEPENMEWLAGYDGKDVICNICLEKVSSEIYILSNFYTTPHKQNTGVGTRLLKSVLNDYEKCKFVLFVDVANKKAVELYKRLGFTEYEKVVSIEIK